MRKTNNAFSIRLHNSDEPELERFSHGKTVAAIDKAGRACWELLGLRRPPLTGSRVVGNEIDTIEHHTPTITHITRELGINPRGCVQRLEWIDEHSETTPGACHNLTHRSHDDSSCTRRVDSIW